MANTMTKIYTVGAGEIDPHNMCRPSALLEFMQDVATEHAIEIKFDRDALMEQYGAFWMMVRLWYSLSRPIMGFEELAIKSWPRPVGGAIILRDFDIFAGDEHVGEAVTAWVLAEYETRKLLRPLSIKALTDFDYTDDYKSYVPAKLRMPKQMERLPGRTVHYSDIDINGHMNNTRYADVACDALGFETMKGKFISEMQIGYMKECFAGDEISLSKGVENGRYYIEGRGDDEKARFDVAMKISSIAE